MDAYQAGRTADDEASFDQLHLFHGQQNSFRQLSFESTDYGRPCLQIPGSKRLLETVNKVFRQAFANGFHDQHPVIARNYSWPPGPRIF